MVQVVAVAPGVEVVVVATSFECLKNRIAATVAAVAAVVADVPVRLHHVD